MIGPWNGAALKEARNELGFSQREVAELLAKRGETAKLTTLGTNVARWEGGRMPPADTMLRLCFILEVSPARLFQSADAAPE